MRTNLPDSNFQSVPLSSNNKFSVYALNDQGLEHYLGYDSHTHHFLNKLDPKILKEFLEEEEANKKLKQQTHQIPKETFSQPQPCHQELQQKEQHNEVFKEDNNSLHDDKCNAVNIVPNTQPKPPQQQLQQKPQQKQKNNINKQKVVSKQQETKKIVQPIAKVNPLISKISTENRIKK